MKSSHTSFLCLFMVLAISAAALAAEHGTGCLLDSPADRAWMEANSTRVTKLTLNALGRERLAQEGGKKDPLRSGIPLTGALPSSIDNSATIYFPPIRDQGMLNSCVSFGVTYYTLTYELARANGWAANTGDQSILRSPKFTYNLANRGRDFGSSIPSTVRILKECGAPSINTWPYNTNYKDLPVTASIWKEAMTRRVDASYFVDQTTLEDPTSTNLLKTALANGYCIPFQTYVSSWIKTTIKNNPATPADDAFVGQSICPFMNGTLESHVMTLVGYNDSIWCDLNGNDVVDSGELGAFKVANSWGTGDWNNGFRWVAYDAFYRLSEVTPTPNMPGRRVLSLYATFFDASIRQPALVATYTIQNDQRNDIQLAITAYSPSGSASASVVPLMTDATFVEYFYDWNGRLPAISMAGTFSADISGLMNGRTDWTDYRITLIDGLENAVTPAVLVSCELEPASGASIPASSFTPANKTALNSSVTALCQLTQPTCAPPSISPPGGILIIGSSLTATATCPTVGATIYYTTDGSTPTTASSVWVGNRTIASSQVINAIAKAPGTLPSSMTSATFTAIADAQASLLRGCDAVGVSSIALSGNAAWHETSDLAWSGTSSLRSGVLGQNQSSTMSITVNGPAQVSWWWCTSSEQYADKLTASVDGSPLASISGLTAWRRSTADIPAGSHVLAWCYSKNNGVNLGRDAGFVDLISVAPAAGPITFSPPGGGYPGPVTVNLSSAPVGSTIYYTTNGTTPTTSSALYTGPISVLSTQTIKAMATATGFLNGQVEQSTYYITSIPAATPVLSPPSLSATAPFTVTVACQTPGAVIHYTLNNTPPSLTSPVVTGPIAISADGLNTLRVLAEAPGYLPSAEASGSYTLPWIPLVVGPRNISMRYGDPVPALEIVYNGFRDGDTPSSLQGALVTSTAAQQWSNVGRYPVTCSGYSSLKYKITYFDGTIQVDPAVPQVSWRSNPTQISFGPTLNDLCSQGVASVAGTWAPHSAYSPLFRPSVGSGSYTFVFTPADATNYLIAHHDVVVTVGQADLTVTADTATCVYGDPIPSLSATVSGFMGSDTIGSLSSRPTATTSAVRGSPVGQYPVYPSCGTNPNYKNIFVDGALTIIQATPVISWTTPAPMRTGRPLSALQLNPTASVPGTFTFSPPMGTVLPAGGTTVSAVFVPSDQINFRTATASVLVTTSATACSIEWQTPAPIVYGSTIGPCLNPTADIPGAFTFDINQDAILHAGTHIVTAQFSSQDGTVTGMSATAAITVLPAPLTISVRNASRSTKVSNPPFEIEYAGFVNRDGPGNLTTGAIATCAATTISPPGVYTIAVAGGSSPDYAITAISGTLTVVATQPVITWATPEAITAGTALTSKQLNAVVDQAGVLTYSPTSGTVLPVGSQILTVSFAPSDQLVAAGSATVALTVTASGAAPISPVVSPIMSAPVGGGGGGGGGGGCGLGGMGCLVIALSALFRRRTHSTNGNHKDLA